MKLLLSLLLVFVSLASIIISKSWIICWEIIWWLDVESQHSTKTSQNREMPLVPSNRPYKNPVWEGCGLLQLKKISAKGSSLTRSWRPGGRNGPSSFKATWTVALLTSWRSLNPITQQNNYSLLVLDEGVSLIGREWIEQIPLPLTEILPCHAVSDNTDALVDSNTKTTAELNKIIKAHEQVFDHWQQHP